MAEEYPKRLNFEARGNRKGLSFRAGSYQLVRGELELVAANARVQKRLEESLAMYDVYPVGATPPASVLEREKPGARPPRPGEIMGGVKETGPIAKMAGHLGDEVENPPDFVAPQQPAARGKGKQSAKTPAIDPELPGAVS